MPVDTAAQAPEGVLSCLLHLLHYTEHAQTLHSAMVLSILSVSVFRGRYVSI